VAVTALIVGELADRYVGHARIFRRIPSGFLAEGAIDSLECEDPQLLPEDALDCAEDLAFSALERLPEIEPSDESSALWALAYVSRARRLLKADEIRHLLEAARDRNTRWDITGALLYFDENFMQYIEGPRSKLELVYRIIRKDPLHTGLIKLMKGPVDGRVFADWRMAFDSPLAPLWAEGSRSPLPPPPAHPDAHGDAVLGMLSLFIRRSSVWEELIEAAAKRK
jgi:hypothetical protein